MIRVVETDECISAAADRRVPFGRTELSACADLGRPEYRTHNKDSTERLYRKRE